MYEILLTDMSRHPMIPFVCVTLFILFHLVCCMFCFLLLSLLLLFLTCLFLYIAYLSSTDQIDAYFYHYFYLQYFDLPLSVKVANTGVELGPAMGTEMDKIKLTKVIPATPSKKRRSFDQQK